MFFRRYYYRKTHFFMRLLLTIVFCAALLGGGYYWLNTHQSNPSNLTNLTNPSAQELASQRYRSGQRAVLTINHNHSTLNPNSWHIDHVDYSQLDGFKRTNTPATAYLDQRNVANDSLRVEQTVKPTGWHQRFDVHHQPILNRGHIIAYSLSKGIAANGQYNPTLQSGDQNNPRNLFTQTAFCNQELQTVYEAKVRHALEQGKRVVYQVQPIFRGVDQMPVGVHMQAISTDKSFNFNVYLFNVQPGFRFVYLTGNSVVNRSMRVPMLPASPHFSN